MAERISVLQPVAESAAAPARLADRLPALTGATVAFVEHPGPNVATLLSALEQELVERGGIERVARLQTTGAKLEIVDLRTNEIVETVLTETPLEEVPKWCHAAVVGVGY